MVLLLRIVAKLPLPRSIRHQWQRTLLDHAYALEIEAAYKENDNKKIEQLESNHRFEIYLYEEDDDAYITKQLITKARRLKVPIPHRTSNGKESEFWYESNHSGRWYLTSHGVKLLRNDIRDEIKARY